MPELAAPDAATATEPRALAGAAIVSIGAAAPDSVVGNAPIAERLGVAERWIETRTGVRERRVALPGKRVYEYAAEAGRRALSAAGQGAEELDLVLVATMSHEQLTPSASALVAAELGAVRAGALDVGAACTGFIGALDVAVGQIESGRARDALVIGADLMHALTNPDDRGTAGLFGDGAGAAVVRATEAPGLIGPILLGADGSNADLIECARDGLIRMKGPDTFRLAVDRLSELTLSAVEAAGRELGDVDLFAYHQANSRIIAAVGERLELPGDRVIDCVPRYGNTSAGSIPIALAEADAAGMLRNGASALLAAFGGGLTWGATIVEWGGSQ